MDAITFNSSGVLYGATGGVGSLYTLDPTTGAATLVGALVGATRASLTYGVNGLAFQPGTGTLYASTSPDSPNSADSLVTINPATGQVTVIGPSGTGNPYTNIAFASNGTLYGWLVSSGSATASLATINLSTGAGNSVGNPQTNAITPYVGLAIDAGGVVYVTANGHYHAPGFTCPEESCSGAFWTVSPDTGAITTIGSLNGGPGVAPAITALAFDPLNGVLYGIEGGEGGGWNLITIDVTPAEANPITYTFNATVSGTLGASAFTETPVIVTFTGNTANIVPGPSPYSDTLVLPGTATVSITGLGTATFTDSWYMVATYTDLAEFGVSGVEVVVCPAGENFDQCSPNAANTLPIYDEAGPVFYGYNLLNFGPLTGPGGPASGKNTPTYFPTTAGELNIVHSSGSGSLTFTAQTTPAPGQILSFTSGASSHAKVGYFGATFTTPCGGPWNNITFSFYGTPASGGAPASAPEAAGTAFLLTQAYTGSPSGLSSSTPGYVASSVSGSGGVYVFPPTVVLNPNTQYWVFENGQLSAISYQAGSPTYNYAVGQSGNDFSPPNTGGGMFNYTLGGTPIPPSGSSVTAYYTGGLFTRCDGVASIDGCPVFSFSDYILASFSFIAPLAPNLSSYSPSPTAWTICDALGYVSLSSTDANAASELQQLSLSTDGNGAIAGYQILVANGGVNTQNTSLLYINNPAVIGGGTGLPLADALNYEIQTASGYTTGNATFGQWTQAVNGLQGGTPAAPVFLLSGSAAASVTGAISGQGAQDYYEFYWGGGTFSASASVTGALNSGASFVFSQGAVSSCNTQSVTLNAANNFSGVLTSSNLPAGYYCIGLNANSANDPTFTITFSTPVAGQSPASCDVQGHRTTTVSDVQQMINEALGLAAPANDLNADGVVNAVDAQITIDAVLNLGCLAGQVRASAAMQRRR